MLLPILAGVAVVAFVVVIILARLAARDRKPLDLGTISDAWIAQHRGSSYDVNR